MSKTGKVNPSKPFSDFFESEKAGGIVLVIATFISLILANSPVSRQYNGFWHISAGKHTLVELINDGLMAVFFLLIGLELKRELYNGELSSLKKAALPIFGALGGMVVPAILFTLFNMGTSAGRGAGIPMATDIAFAIGILSLLGKSVPNSLKIFITALAVIDDIGAILVIAVFYSSDISVLNLSIAFAVFGVLLLLNRLKIFNLIPYLTGGVIMWYFMMQSGVQAAITGILLAFAIPSGENKKGKSPSEVLQHFLHKPVAFLILPVFAMANTCIPLGSDWTRGLLQKSSIGIVVGLVIGKPLGIWLFSFAAKLVGLCKLPPDLNWKHILGAGFLGGIGFTMSIFITLLAFDNESIINSSKIAILLASLVAGTVGFLWLRAVLRTKEDARNKKQEKKAVDNWQ